jgi:exonuclease VII small subunit
LRQDLIQQWKTDEEKRQLEAAIVDLKAKSASAKKLSEELAEHRKKLQKLYDEAKAKADKAAERGFALQMVAR